MAVTEGLRCPKMATVQRKASSDLDDGVAFSLPPPSVES